MRSIQEVTLTICNSVFIVKKYNLNPQCRCHLESALSAIFRISPSRSLPGIT